LQTHYCFFNLGGKAHELAVKEVALFLWMKYHASHRVKFISVPFEGVVEEILNNVDNAHMGVVLKRIMLRAAEKLAQGLHIEALVTGESVAQVSSQTLANLSVIDRATDCLVLRPLATADKQEIINIARTIGTEEFSKDIPEYCAVISNKPTTRGKLERVEWEESKFDMAVLDTALENARHQLISELVDDLSAEAAQVKIVSTLDSDSTVIDIRHPDRVDITPFPLSGEALKGELLSIPFYRLRSSFADLDKDKRYLLYCGKGMMSRLHAANLVDEGFGNVAVLELESASKL
jgi:thiamine biosynthesis protein ThiI